MKVPSLKKVQEAIKVLESYSAYKAMLTVSPAVKPSRKMSDCKSRRIAPEVAELYKSGLSMYDVAVNLGVVPGTVRRALDEAGVKLRPAKGNNGRVVPCINKKITSTVEELQKMYSSGMSLEEVAATQGVSRERIRQVLRKHTDYKPHFGSKAREVKRNVHRTVIALYESGKKPKEIADELGLARANTYQIIKDYCDDRGMVMRSSWMAPEPDGYVFVERACKIVGVSRAAMNMWRRLKKGPKYSYMEHTGRILYKIEDLVSFAKVYHAKRSA
jgi:DNA-binding CsgD family transcriptional regulator